MIFKFAGPLLVSQKITIRKSTLSVSLYNGYKVSYSGQKAYSINHYTDIFYLQAPNFGDMGVTPKMP